jgi:hypothetical protein
MSGGSWDYFYQKVDTMAHSLMRQECPYRKALGEKLLAFVTPLHHIEWVDSFDMSFGEELPAIKAALGEQAASLALAQYIAQGNDFIHRLTELMDTIKKEHGIK